MIAEYLLVRVSGTAAALPASAVRRVAGALPLAPVPGAGRGLLGLIEFAGEPLAVLDLAGLLGLDSAEIRRPTITVVARLGRAGERELVGLAVDEALGVVPLAVPPEGGETKHEGVPVRFVDLERLGETS